LVRRTIIFFSTRGLFDWNLGDFSIDKNTYGVAKSTIAGWVKKYSEECQYIKLQNKNNNNSNEEIRALNKKIKELEKENDFLKKAAAFFAKGID